jgi:hypothetical protein
MKKIMFMIFIVIFTSFSLCGCTSPSPESEKSSPDASLKQNIEAIEGYSFEKYEIKKVNVDFSSNPFWKTYRTRISEVYKDGNVGFGGYYVTVIINCGVTCRVGAMVDIRDGKIYSLPLGDDMGYAECYSNRNVVDDEGIHYKPNSRLFITSSCSETEIENSKNNKQHKVYFINVWDEAKKKFILEKKIEKSLIVEREV